MILFWASFKDEELMKMKIIYNHDWLLILLALYSCQVVLRQLAVLRTGFQRDKLQWEGDAGRGCAILRSLTMQSAARLNGEQDMHTFGEAAAPVQPNASGPANHGTYGPWTHNKPECQNGKERSEGAQNLHCPSDISISTGWPHSFWLEGSSNTRPAPADSLSELLQGQSRLGIFSWSCRAVHDDDDDYDNGDDGDDDGDDVDDDVDDE